MNKDFDTWNSKKIKINELGKRPLFSEREVWFCKLGVNIGYEQDGKGKDYLRPVVILKKFNRSVFLAVPLTHTLKNNRYYHHFIFKKEGSVAILSQIRLIDSKRLFYREGKVSTKDFTDIKTKIKQLLA